MADYVVNQVTCDWLTIATFDVARANDLTHLLESRLQFSDKPAKRLQYVGKAAIDVGLFIGWGEQKGKAHCMVQASGLFADTLLDLLSKPDANASAWNCTRLDVQETRYIEGYHLSGWEWVARNAGKRVVEHKTKGGMDTVYLGSRTSETFCRVYVKDTQADDTAVYGQFVRVEFELKGRTAKQVYKSVTTHWETLQALYRGLWDKLVPEERDDTVGFLDCFCPIVWAVFQSDTEGVRVRCERDRDTVKWLKTTVTSAIVKMLRDHDSRLLMLALLDDWQKTAYNDY